MIGESHVNSDLIGLNRFKSGDDSSGRYFAVDRSVDIIYDIIRVHFANKTIT